MENIGKALAEYTAIVEGVAREYGDGATVEQIRADHPELDFMDNDEIETIIRQARERGKQ